MEICRDGAKGHSVGQLALEAEVLTTSSPVVVTIQNASPLIVPSASSQTSVSSSSQVTLVMNTMREAGIIPDEIGEQGRRVESTSIAPLPLAYTATLCICILAASLGPLRWHCMRS